MGGAAAAELRRSSVTCPAPQVERDEAYIKTVVKLTSLVEGLIKSNNAIDIYEEYFPAVGTAAMALLGPTRLRPLPGRGRGVHNNRGPVLLAPRSDTSRSHTRHCSRDGGPRQVAPSRWLLRKVGGVGVAGHRRRRSRSRRAHPPARFCACCETPAWRDAERSTSRGIPTGPAASPLRTPSW